MNTEKFDLELDELLGKQKQVVEEYETILAAYKHLDLKTENEQLTKELANYKGLYEETYGEYLKLKEEVSALKWTLHEQVLSERIKCLTSSKEMLEAYFKAVEGQNINKLQQVEGECLALADGLSHQVESQLVTTKENLLEDITQIRERIKWAIKYEAKQRAEKQEDIQAQTEEAFVKLKSEPLSEEMLQKRLRQNSIESKIGLNWLNKLGVFLILIGIITVMQYSFTNYFGPVAKALFGVLIGGIFLGVGEWSYKKDRRVFAVGVIGGGLGTFYLTLFSSYYFLNLLSMPMALCLACFISVVAFGLSRYHRSEVIGSFALIGGYLPLLALALEGGIKGDMVYFSILYLLLLNGVALILARYHTWQYLSAISFWTNIPCFTFLAYHAPSPLIAILFSVITFGIYLSLGMMETIKKQSQLGISQILILSFNTLVSCSLLYYLVIEAGLGDFKWVLALLFGGLYYILGEVVERKQPKEKTLPFLFYVATVVFVILFVPFLMGKTYYALGWLLEGVVLIILGKQYQKKHLTVGGWGIYALCTITFLGDWLNYVFTGELSLFIVKYTFIVLGTMIILGTYLRVDEILTSIYHTIFKYYTILMTWGYCNYICLKFYNLSLGEYILSGTVERFYQLLIFSTITLVFAYGIPKFKVLYSKEMDWISIGGFLLVDYLCIQCNATSYVTTGNQGVILTILVIWNVICFFNVKDLVKRFIVSNQMGVQNYGLCLATYILFNITCVLKIQFLVPLSSMMMSLVYLVAALVLIILGFKNKDRLMRYWGLGLCIASIGKLFLFDLVLDTPISYRIISYFAFGVILLLISYIYQRFSNYLELKGSNQMISTSQEQEQEE